jgi:Flp pilus assembly protein TadG
MRKTAHLKRPPQTGARSRSGVAVFEFVVFAPILLICLVAIVEFGLVFANTQTVELASRTATKAAAEATQADVLSGVAITNIRNVADQVLATGGLVSSGVVLEHRVAGGNGSFTSGTCTAPAGPVLPTEAVRVTVCLDLSQLTPNLLSTFGFSTAGRTVRQTTTMRFEGP